MARTIAVIKQGILDSISGNEILNTRLTSTSSVAMFGLFAGVVASAIWLVEVLFDSHKSEVDETLAEKSPHTELWYRNKALAFQYGHSLIADSDLYAVDDPDARIILHAAVREILTPEGLYLNIKVAKADAENGLAELTGEWPTTNEPGTGTGEKLAFANYMYAVKDAGVRLRFVSREADDLNLTIEIYYDPQVLDGIGQRLDGAENTPVQDAIDTYLRNLPFNGEYTNMSLTDAIQVIEGIKICQLLGAEARYGVNDFIAVITRYIPEAGWLRVETLNITWVPYE